MVRCVYMYCDQLVLQVMICLVSGSLEWEREWLELDKDQLIEFLDSSDLKIRDEYDLWNAVVKWLL